MESEVVLYKSTGLQPEKQFIIEDIDAYLFLNFGSDRTTISKYQYIKHGLNIAIKLNLSQTYLNSLAVNDYDYLTIKNGTEKVYRYFITGKRWLSTETVEFQLAMDTLNTFQWNVDYTVDKKTLVIREHQDRVVKRAVSPYFHFPLARIIPLRSEGINPPLYRRYNEKIIQNETNISWILYYRNKNNYNQNHPEDFTLDNPVDCFIAPSEPIKSKYATNNTTINKNDFPTTGFYYIFGGYQFDINGTIYPPSYWEIEKTASGLTFRRCYVREELVPGTQQDPEYELYIYEKEEIASNQASFDVVEPVNTKIKFYYWSSSQSYPEDIWNETHKVEITVSPTSITFWLTPESIDRTDSRNIKIIELPYAPTSITYDKVNDVYLFDGNWEYDATQKLFKLVNLNNKFSSDIISQYNPLKEKGISQETYEDLHGEDSPADTDLREDILEGKIYHSDFYRPKFVYDSFFLTFQLENLRAIDSAQYDPDDNPFTINFVASSNVISKFLFMFPQYRTFYGNADFDNVVAVSRNNEQVIYNSQYLNYIRNGYNYDLKSKQRMEETGGVGLGISIASTILGVVGSVATGNYGTAILAGVGGALTIANQSMTYAKNVAQTEQNLQEKLQNARMQSVNVLNADDIDLLNAYSDNKAKWCVYEVSPTMKQALLDMFYYAGYATNEQKIPSIDTRFWFNYLQCDLVVDGTNNLPESIIQDIKNRFKDGCTFFHNRKTDPDSLATSRWNVAQTLENYETWILS